MYLLPYFYCVSHCVPLKNSLSTQMFRTIQLVGLLEQSWLDMSIGVTMIYPNPETNSKSTWKWMVGIRSFSFWGPTYLQGFPLAVRFRVRVKVPAPGYGCLGPQDDRLVNEYHIYFAKMISNDQSAQCNFEVCVTLPAGGVVGVWCQLVCCDHKGELLVGIFSPT